MRLWPRATPRRRARCGAADRRPRSARPGPRPTRRPPAAGWRSTRDGPQAPRRGAAVGRGRGRPGWRWPWRPCSPCAKLNSSSRSRRPPGTRRRPEGVRLGGLASGQRGPDGDVQSLRGHRKLARPRIYRGDLPDLFREGQGVATSAFRRPHLPSNPVWPSTTNLMPREVPTPQGQGAAYAEGRPAGSLKGASPHPALVLAALQRHGRGRRRAAPGAGRAAEGPRRSALAVAVAFAS